MQALNRCFVAAVLCASINCAFARTRDLNVGEARKLIEAAVGGRVRNLPGFTLEINNNDNVPGFLNFDATFDNPHGSPVVGFYAVNQVTGEVWKLVICRKVDSAELRRLQTNLHKQLQISAEELKQSWGKAPCQF